LTAITIDWPEGAMDDTHPVPAVILDEMAAYYRDRAPEYNAWFERRGNYDHGEAANAQWFAEVAAVFAVLDELAMTGDILELAAGSGIWTERLLRTASTVTAVDASLEMLALNRARVDDDRVRYVEADLFSWRPERTYDGVCFAFWLSHVPHERLDAFLEMVAVALEPGGKVFFVDSHRQRKPSTETVVQSPPEPGSQVLTRRLHDGRAYRIVKNFYEPVELADRCAAAGLQVTVRETASFFIYGAGSRGR
jgi:2-polyprenyl-3-methyl-5-hydroxy-6-metoxy-1,4-benzoquinol methylase